MSLEYRIGDVFDRLALDEINRLRANDLARQFEHLVHVELVEAVGRLVDACIQDDDNAAIYLDALDEVRGLIEGAEEVL